MNYTQGTPTGELEAIVEAYWCPNPFPKPEGFSRGFSRALLNHCPKTYGGYPSMDMMVALIQCAEEFYEQEDFYEIQFERLTPSDPIGIGRYRDGLFNLARFVEHDPQAVVAEYVSRLIKSFDEFLGALPSHAFFPKAGAELDPETPSEPFLDITDDQTHLLVEDMLRPLVSEKTFGLFGALQRRLDENAAHVFKGEAAAPRDWRGDPRKSVKAYLDGIPLYDLFQLDIPILQPPKLPEPEPGAPLIEDRHWYQHCLLLASTGGGKTNAVRWRIAQMLPQVARGEASLILMEPKGVLTREILQMEYVWGLRDRLVILDPADTPVSVNLFERGDGSPQAINDTIARVSRIFSTITATLTPMQRSTLTYALRAMLASTAPASMRTLMGILRRGIKDLRIDNLSFAVQEFFDNDFKAGDGRAAEIITRLGNLLADPVFEALFASERTTFNMFTEMQAGKLIVINASAADPLYGRFWIEEVARCIGPRLALKASERTPTTFVIDEAQTYIAHDLHFAEILDLAREARLGMLIAAHHMGQIQNEHVRNSLYTNTALKFVARTSADIHNLCRSMGYTEPTFLTTMPDYHFGFFGPNMREAAIAYLPLVEFDSLPSMSSDQYAELRRLNRERYAYTPQAQPQQQAAPPAPPTISPPRQEPEDRQQSPSEDTHTEFPTKWS